jgi:polysaccharide biosynthesis protein PelG
MAGIGFALRRLVVQDSLSAKLHGFAHAAVVSSGPWILTILALAVVEMEGSRFLDRQSVQQFGVIVVYNFAFSLVISGPVVLIVNRGLADQIYQSKFEQAPGMLVGALALLLAMETAVGVPFYGFAASLTLGERLLALADLWLIGAIWLAVVFISALKSFTSITASFAIGLATGTAAAIQLAKQFGTTGLLAGFTVGLAVIFFSLIGRILTEYSAPIIRPFAFLALFRRYWDLALAGLLYNAGVWVDKWIMWFSPGRVVFARAMPVHPAYDAGMFLAYLSSLPAMILFLVIVETRFFELYLRFYRAIEQHATWAEIKLNHRQLLQCLAESATIIVTLQAVVCYVTILVAPGLTGLAKGGPEVVPIFRYGVIGALFHVLIFFAMAIISYFDLRKLLLLVAAGFLVLNGGLTALSTALGPAYYGYGYFIAALLSFLIAYSAVIGSILRLPYMTFIANNPGLR